MKGSSNVLLTTLHSCPLRRSVSPISGGGCCVNASISKSPFGYRISNRRPGMCAAFPTPEARKHLPEKRASRSGSPKEKFTEPVALSSTRPGDRPLPRRASRESFDLLALRARCERKPSGAVGEASRRSCRDLSHFADSSDQSTLYALGKRCRGSEIAGLHPQPGRLRRLRRCRS